MRKIEQIWLTLAGHGDVARYHFGASPVVRAVLPNPERVGGGLSSWLVLVESDAAGSFGVELEFLAIGPGPSFDGAGFKFACVVAREVAPPLAIYVREIWP